MLIKTKSGRLVEMPTPEEDAIITAAAMSDPDAIPLTDEEWEAVKPFVRIGCQPTNSSTQVLTTIGFDAEVLAALKALGNDWQARINNVMRDYVATIKHS